MQQYKQYKYKAVNLQRKKITGWFIAEDETDLAVKLSRQGLYLISCSAYNGKPASSLLFGLKRASTGELTTFCRQYAIILTAGIPLLDGIELLQKQHFSHSFRSVLRLIGEDVRAGMMLSAAMDKYKQVFPDFFRSMVKIGEASGKLDAVMRSLADYCERDAALRKKTRDAMAYPVMIGIMTISVVIIMLLFVVPIFRDSLSSLRVEPSGLSRTVYSVSDFLITKWYYLLTGAGTVAFLLLILGMTEKGRYFYDCLAVYLPFIGRVTTDKVTARFARSFSLLLASGVGMSEALSSVSVVLDNRNIERRFRLAANEVQEGVPLSVAFARHKLFPPIMLQMVSVGESTAALDEVLGRACSFLDATVEETLNRFVSRLQPTMLLILGGIVGILFIAMYSPMISIMTGIGI